jgi:hypothetical protein
MPNGSTVALATTDGLLNEAARGLGYEISVLAADPNLFHDATPKKAATDDRANGADFGVPVILNRRYI